MATRSKSIDLRLSKASLDDAKRFRDELEKMQTRAGELRQDLKDISDLTKSIKMREILVRQNGGGVGGYLQGQQFLEGQRVRQMQRLGTLSGQVMENNRRTVGFARQGLKLHKDQGTLQEAQNINLRTQSRTLNKITDLQAAKNKLSAAEVRLGIETYEGNRRAAKSAERIVGVLRDRVQVLQEEERIRARIEKQKMAERARPTPDQRAADQRDMNRRRMFGDGGAGLFAIQSGIMANYMVMSGSQNIASNAVNFTVELDEALRNLQAITATTDGSMETLGRRLIDVAESTKFTAVEVANAAVTLGQAGLSTQEIEDSIEAVTLLATATGTDLPRAVDIATSVLGVFSMQSSQMADVSNVMTEAVNSSKLNIEKLTLGLQYSGNIAAQSGVRFDELTSALGAMANAGIRSGSTLGTGMRQILISLQKPSGAFKDTLERLGLTMYDVDIRTKGLYGVLSTLSEAGFTAGDAINSFEVRAAAAFNALANNLDQMLDLESSFQNTTAAARANETQMRSLANQGRLFNAAFGALASTALEPFKVLLRDLLGSMADFMSMLRQNESAVQAFVTSLVAAVGAFALWRFGKLITGLVRFATGAKKSSLAVTQWRRSTLLASVSLTGLSASLTGVERRMMVSIKRAGILRTAFVALTGPLGMVATVVGTAASAFFLFRKEAERTADGVDAATTVFNDSMGEMEQSATRIENVNDRLQELLDRYEILGSDSRLLKSEINSIKGQFWELGLTVSQSQETVDGLISVLRELRRELRDEYVGRIRLAIEGGEGALTALGIDRRNQVGDAMANLPTASNAPFVARPSRGGPPVGPNPGAMEAQRTFSQMGSQLASLLRPLASLDDVSVDEARAAFNEAQSLLNQVELKLEDQNLSDQDRKIFTPLKDNLEMVFKTTMEVLRIVQDEQGLRDELQKQRRELVSSAELQNPATASVLDGAKELSSSVTNRFGAAASSVQGRGALAALAAGQQARADIDAEVEELRRSVDTLAQSGLIGPENIKSFEIIVSELMGRVQQEVLQLAEAADQVETEMSDGNLRTAREKLRKFQNELRQEDTTSGIETLLVDQMEAINQYAALRRQRLENTDFADPALMAQEIEAMDLEINGMVEQAQTQAGEAIEKILNKTAEEDIGKKRTLAQLDLDRARTHLGALKKQLQWAETIEDTNEIYREIIDALQGVTDATAQVDGLRDDAGDADIVAKRAADRAAEADAALAEAQNLLDRSQKRVTKQTTSGGGGSDTDPVREWLDRAASQLTALETGKGRNNSSGMSRIFEETEARLAEITSQMSALQGRASNGTLTANEQERLNTLVERHGQLTQFIDQNEKRIFETKLLQGDAQGALVEGTKSWVEANLDVGATLMGGLTTALSSARTSIANFFTEWTDGTKKGKDAFRDMAGGIVKALQGVFAEMLTVYILQKTMGMLGASSGSTVGDLFSAVTGLGLKDGGSVKRMDRGGSVQGNVQRDSVKALLMPDEYVLRASAAKAIGHDQLDQINAMGNRASAQSLHQGVVKERAGEQASNGTVNFFLVDDRSQVGTLGPQDVLAVVGDDIARGGATKKLIKSVQMGTM